MYKSSIHSSDHGVWITGAMTTQSKTLTLWTTTSYNHLPQMFQQKITSFVEYLRRILLNRRGDVKLVHRKCPPRFVQYSSIYLYFIVCLTVVGQPRRVIPQKLNYLIYGQLAFTSWSCHYSMVQIQVVSLSASVSVVSTFFFLQSSTLHFLRNFHRTSIRTIHENEKYHLISQL